MRNMPLNKLTEVRVKSAPPKAVLGDGGGLYLRAGLWVFRFTSPITGKERDLSIGPLTSVSLKAARKRATEYRELLTRKIDPHQHVAQQLEAERAKAAANITFGEVASKWMEAKLSERKSEKNQRAMRAKLKDHTKPLANVPMIAINSMMIAEAVKPLNYRPAQRDSVVGLIHIIFDWAMAADLIPEGLNPARARKLGKLLPERKTPIRHNRFVALDALPAFMAKLSAIPGNLARCLEFTVHSGLRQNEAVNLQWDWVNIADRSILIPGAFMKAKKDHAVYLSDRAYTLIMNMVPQRRPGALVFPGGSATGTNGLRSLRAFVAHNFPEAGAIQVHGCRASLKSWATAHTNHRRELIEVTLAHQVGGDVEAAYLHVNDLRAARTRLYADWSAYLTSTTAVPDADNVVPLYAAQ
jgi:integrase